MNKKKLLIKILPILFMIVIFLGFCHNLSLLWKIGKFSAYTQLYIKNEANSLNGEKASELVAAATKKQAEFPFVVFGKKLQETVFSKELDKTIETDVLVLQGNSQILFPEATALYADNKTQCLISSTLANKLFGSKDVKGLIIVYNRSKYEILSVIPSNQAFFVYESDSKEVTGMDRITLLSSVKTNKVLLTKKFENQYSLKVDLLNYDVFRVLLVLAHCLLILLLILIVCLLICKKRKQATLKQLKSHELIIGLWLFSLIGLFILFIQQIQLSSEYLPTRLSDFSFFADQKEKLADNLLLLWQSKKYDKELNLLSDLWMVFVSALIIIPFVGGYWWSVGFLYKNIFPSKKKRRYQLLRMNEKKAIRFFR